MPISSNSAPMLEKTFKVAIAKFYGDTVPTLPEFKKKRRATFKEKLLEQVGAKTWWESLSNAEKHRSTKQGALTLISNNLEQKRIEMRERHNQEMEALRLKQSTESSKLTADYEPRIIEAKTELAEADKALRDLQRQSYFAALGEEDDGRYVGGTPTLERAIDERVDRYMELSLDADEEGRSVERRMNEEQLTSDVILFAKDIPDLREKILKFIALGKIPKVTIEAWGIENGEDKWSEP